jgi:hypothetical protein
VDPSRKVVFNMSLICFSLNRSLKSPTTYCDPSNFWPVKKLAEKVDGLTLCTFVSKGRVG